jgi:uncharacterized surface anchored protein
MKKRVLALTSVILLLLSLFPFTASATKFDYDNTYKLTGWSSDKQLIFDSGNYSAVKFNIKNNTDGSFATYAFCGDLSMSTATNTDYEAFTLEDSGKLAGRLGSNVSRVRAIILKALTSGGGINTSAIASGAGVSLTDSEAVWGTQIALWQLIEGVTFSHVSGEAEDGPLTQKLKAVRDYLLGLPGVGGISSVEDTTVEISDTYSSYVLSEDGTKMLLTYDITSTNVESINFNLITAPANSTISGDTQKAVVAVPVEAFYAQHTVNIAFEATVQGPQYSDAVVFIALNDTKQILLGRISIRNDDKDSVEDSFTDPGSAKFRLVKNSQDTDLPMAGVTFTLRGPTDVPATENNEISLTTNENGEVEFTGLYAGHYVLTEPNPIEGYVNYKFTVNSDIEVGSFEIELPPTYDNSGNIVNNIPEPASIKLRKMSAFTGQALEGAQFELYNGTSKVAGPESSGADGVVTFTGLYPGDGVAYTLKEVVTPNGYKTMSDVTLPVLHRGENMDLSDLVEDADYILYNQIKPVSISVKKLDDYYASVLSGAKFELYEGALDETTGEPTGSPIDTKTTGSSGIVVFENLVPQKTYVIKEAAAPSGYDLANPSVIEVTVNTPGQTKELTFRNTPHSGSLTVTKTFDGINDSARFANVDFTLEGPYLDASTKTPVPNYAASVIDPSSKSNGVFTFTGLVHGEYILSEQTSGNVGDDYEAISDRIVSVGIAQAVSESVDNKSIKGTFQIQKSVSETYEGDPYAPLEGIEFSVYSDEALSNKIATLVTDTNGRAVSGSLSPGKYYIKETSAPSVYKTNSTVYEVEILYKSQRTAEYELVSVTNEKLQADFALQKLSSYDDSPLEGAEFTLTAVFDPSISYPLLTDSDGRAQVTDLIPGQYVLEEVKAPTGYDIAADMNGDGTDDPDGIVIDIAPGRTTQGEYVVALYNDPQEAQAIVTKFSSTSRTLRLQGVKFALYKDSVAEANKIGDSKYTDEDGIVSWQGLFPGNYVLVEEATIAGYMMPADPNTEFTLQGGERKAIILENTPFDGNFTVTKTFDGINDATLFDDVDFTLEGPYSDAAAKTPLPDYAAYVINPTSKSNGVFTFTGLVYGEYILSEQTSGSVSGNYEAISDKIVTVGTSQALSESVDNKSIKGTFQIQKSVSETYAGDPYAPLEGIEFSVYSDEALSNKIATLVTDTSGRAVSDELSPGKYYIKETSAPSVYKTNSTVYEVEILYKSQRTTEYELVSVTNEKLQADFALQKLSSFDDSPLGGAEFTLTAVFDPSISYRLVTGTDGRAQVTDLIPGQYVLNEVKAPVGYDIVADMDGDGTDDPDGILIDIAPGRTAQGEYVVALYNDPQEAQAVIAKFSSASRTVRLQGVRFALYKDSVSAANKIGASKYTDGNGNVTWQGLVPGNYVLVEEATIAGYVMPANPNTAFTLQGGERKVIILENAPITTPTPTPPTTTPPNTPESTPTPTPTATPSPTPINTDEFEIDDVDPAFGPETGEGDFLFMIAAFLVVAGIALVAIKRKLILHK